MPYLKGRKKYAKLEQMSIEELEKLLALEMRLPEEDRDTEFYDEVEEVLLQKVSDTPEGRITEVEAAWKDFEKNYLPKVGAEEGKAVPKKITQSKMQHPRWGHLAVAAAMIVVIFSAMAIPSAFGAENLFTVIGRWTDSVFSFERDGTNTQSTAPFDVDSFPSDNADLRQLYIAVSSYIGDAQVIPTWMPESFILDSVTISPFADYQTIRARFLRDDAMITIQIVAMNNAADSASTQYEKDDAEVEIVTIDSIDYYLMKNESVWCCSWVNNNLECHIFGDITKEDLYKIINSIGGSTT